MSVQSYQDSVRALGCIVCRSMDNSAGHHEQASIHHIESIRDALSEYAVVPLCYDHHQGPNGIHGLSRRGFERMYKLTEIDLLALVARELHRREK